MNELYHATLAQNAPSIKEKGLLPRRGSWTATFHLNAAELVYAVDESRRGRLIVIMAGQIAKSGLVRCSDDYQFDNFQSDLAKHGAVVVVKAEKFCCCQTFFEPGHPQGVEPGDWYSRQPIGIEDIHRIVTGAEMVAWLKPHEMDFKYRYREVLGK